MMHGTAPHLSFPQSLGHIKLQSRSGHSPKVNVRGESSGDGGGAGGEEGEKGRTKCQCDGGLKCSFTGGKNVE